MRQNHHSPVFSDGIHAFTGSSQVKGNVTAFHIRYGPSQSLFQKLQHIDSHFKNKGIFALDFLHKHILHPHLVLNTFDESVKMHLKSRHQVSVLPEIQAEQSIDLFQGFRYQLLGIHPLSIVIDKIAGVIGSPSAHDYQGKHAHLAVVDRYVQPLGNAFKEGLGYLVLDGFLQPLHPLLHIDVIGAVHPFNAGPSVENQHGKHGLMDGIVIFFQYIHKNILDLNQVKASVEMSQGVQVKEVLLHLSHQ